MKFMCVYWFPALLNFSRWGYHNTPHSKLCEEISEYIWGGYWKCIQCQHNLFKCCFWVFGKESPSYCPGPRVPKNEEPVYEWLRLQVRTMIWTVLLRCHLEINFINFQLTVFTQMTQSRNYLWSTEAQASLEILPEQAPAFHGLKLPDHLPYVQILVTALSDPSFYIWLCYFHVSIIE